jgi:hypothetical protein
MNGDRSSRRGDLVRRGSAAALVVLALTTLASLGSAGVKKLAVLQSDYQYCTTPSQYQYCSPTRIVFASARTGVAQLYSVEPSGDGLAQLTFGAGNWGDPVPSPDGRFVAAFRGPELWLPYPADLVPAPRPELWLMRADGSGARLISPNAAGAYWSSDSRRLLFVSATGDIYTVAAAGGQPRLLTKAPDGESPTPSPDGRSIAFVRKDLSGVPHLVVRRDGYERTVAQGFEGRIFWSPNGRWIAIRDRDYLAVVLASGGDMHLFSADHNYCPFACVAPAVAWSSDSRRFAYESANGIMLAAPSGDAPTNLDKELTQGLALSPRGDAITFATRSGIRILTLDGHIRDLVSFGPGEALPGIALSSARQTLPYQAPEDAALLVRVSGHELEARLPIRQLSADGDRVAYWLCPHSFGAWRPGDAPVALGPPTLAACLVPTSDQAPESNVYDLSLAGDQLAYLTRSDTITRDGKALVWQLWLTTLERGDEGVSIESGSEIAGEEARYAPLEDLLGGGSALVFGLRAQTFMNYRHPEEVWRLDGARLVPVARRSYELQPLAVDDGRVVARHADGSLELLSLDGSVLETFDVPSLGAALAGDDLVVLVQGELRDYSVSSGELLHAWPLPDVPSSGRCRLTDCPGVRLTLDDAARGVVVYTLDGVVHLLRMSNGEDKTVPGATVAELTDAGLFYAYAGADPWPGRIRFVPFDELP